MMRLVLESIATHAANHPGNVALVDELGTLTYGELPAAIAHAASILTARRVASMIDNSNAWAVVDLALARNEAVSIPIPPFFSDGQAHHLIDDAAPDLIITDQPQRITLLTGLSPIGSVQVAGRELFLFSLPAAAQHPLPADTCKITYTSGTTGQPRGVCLSAQAIEAVTLSLAGAVDAAADDRSLALLPLSTLLENIGGLYVPLLSGSTAAVPSLASCGFAGSSVVQPGMLIAALHQYLPSATILVPQLLKLLVECLAAGASLPGSLRFVAVGGAPCALTLIERARGLGLPVYEGYGLSEAGSVVSMNRAETQRPGSVGMPLPHASVRIAGDGEIVVAGHLFSGYLGSASTPPVEWPTGDLGHLDAEGYLYVTGRKKTAFATAFGRNVSPEWVEGELTAGPTVMQAAVFGEGHARNVAVLVVHPAAQPEQIAAAVAAANARLPDYARVAAWHLADAPFSRANGLARSTGLPDREAIAHHFADALEQLHASETSHVDV